LTENHRNALQTVVSELKNFCPDIAGAFVFKADGETLASSQKTTPEQTQSLISSLKAINAQSIGGIEHFIIQDVNSQLCLTAVGDVYLGTIIARTADQKIVKSLTQVVLPAFIQLTVGVPVKQVKVPKLAAPEEPYVDAALAMQKAKPPVAIIAHEVEEPQKEAEEAPQLPEPLLPTAPTTQFMVERIGGILVASDTVRIDSETIQKWQDLYGGKPFSHVNIETLEGKTIVCKHKPLSNSNAKGIIQIPGKIIQDLGTDRGKLVMVKPAIK